MIQDWSRLWLIGIVAALGLRRWQPHSTQVAQFLWAFSGAAFFPDELSDLLAWDSSCHKEDENEKNLLKFEFFFELGQ